MFEFTIMQGGNIMQLSIKDRKQASSFEALLNDFKIAYQLHDNVTHSDKAVTGGFSEDENDYAGYTEQPVLSWLEQIEAMRNEGCSVNL